MPSELEGDPTAGATWRGGASINGKIYLCPYSGNHVLIYDPVADSMSGSAAISADIDGGDKQWLGGVALNGKLYCIPLNAKHVLVYDTATGLLSDAETSPKVPDSLINGKDQWARGVELNGKVGISQHLRCWDSPVVCAHAQKYTHDPWRSSILLYTSTFTA